MFLDRNIRIAAAAAVFALACPLRAATGRTPPLPSVIGPARFQALLQSFVDHAYLKAFRHLGDERDFDHGHFLFASDAPHSAPVAILYHTQELAYYESPRDGYGWIDPDGRNWIQWLVDGRVENARFYRRRALPRSFPLDESALQRHHTILADMLDPSTFGSRSLRSRQVVFTRTDCAAGSRALVIRLPSAQRVCLSLSEY